MKFVKQFAIILLISFFGETLSHFLPLPIPATVWGMCLMFAALATGILKLDQVENTADFLLGIISMMFLPYGVALMTNYEILMAYALPILIITFVSFVVCFTVTGKTADFLIIKDKTRGNNNDPLNINSDLNLAMDLDANINQGKAGNSP